MKQIKTNLQKCWEVCDLLCRIQMRDLLPIILTIDINRDDGFTNVVGQAKLIQEILVVINLYDGDGHVIYTTIRRQLFFIQTWCLTVAVPHPKKGHTIHS